MMAATSQRVFALLAVIGLCGHWQSGAQGTPRTPKTPTVTAPRVTAPTVKPPVKTPAVKPSAAPVVGKQATALAERLVSGTLTLGAKPYNLTTVVIFESLTFDKPTHCVMASDSAIPLDKLKVALAKDGTDDSFMFWKPNIKVVFNDEGKPMFANAYANNNSVSMSGNLTGEIVIEDGIARGSVTMPADDKGSHACDFKFVAAVMGNTFAQKKSAAAKAEKTSPADNGDDGDEDSEKSEVPPRPTLNIYALPLPKDAAELQYKSNVEQLAFKTKSSIAALAKSFAAQLETAGWRNDKNDLVAAKSAILHRNQGGAKLTIFIKPDAAGTRVLIMAKGLSWDKPAQAEQK